VKTIVPPASPEGVKTRKMPIVVIDDDHAIRLSCSQALTKTGYDVTTFEDGASGLKGVTEIKPELLVVDLKMAGLSGLEVIERVHQIDPDIVIIVITGYATIGTAVDAMKAGAYDFLPSSRTNCASSWRAASRGDVCCWTRAAPGWSGS
jgi:two-component system sensor histidine kinase/response regulator